MLLYLLSIGIIAAVFSYLITLFVRMQARRWAIVDHSDSHHGSHHLPVALDGGLAVFFAATGTFAVEYFSSPKLQELLHEDMPFLKGLLIASSWTVILGLYSEYFRMRNRYKLVGQVLATLILVASGLQIHAFTIFDYSVQLGAYSAPITILWLLVAINSISLLDRLDGVATTAGIILCATIPFLTTSPNQTGTSIVGAVTVGSLAGFLPFNLPPATIRLGDAGSMLIGLIIGTLALGG